VVLRAFREASVQGTGAVHWARVVVGRRDIRDKMRAVVEVLILEDVFN
jgi:hypothetical protein